MLSNGRPVAAAAVPLTAGACHGRCSPDGFHSPRSSLAGGSVAGFDDAASLVGSEAEASPDSIKVPAAAAERS